VISDQYNLPGHTCRPLQKDPLYGLQITYDECLETHYDKVTTDNLFEPSIDAKYAALNGPWNFSKHTEGYSYEDTFYHKPFPKLTDVVYTLHPTCKVEVYPGFLEDIQSEGRRQAEREEDLSSSLGQKITDMELSDSPRFPMDDAYEDAQISPGLHSYSRTCIMNKKCAYGKSCKYGEYRTFYPEAGIDFLRECDKGGGMKHFKNSRYDYTKTTRPEKNFFTADMQAGLYAHGGYVCPHVWARDLLISSVDTVGLRYVESFDAFISGQMVSDKVEELTDDRNLQIKPRSVGIRSMYPLTQSLWDNRTLIGSGSLGTGWTGSWNGKSQELKKKIADFLANKKKGAIDPFWDPFFSAATTALQDPHWNGGQSCEFYEREMARQGFEFIYSRDNCHPCDAFKLNTPFHCETVVKKTAAEIIGLSVSNVMALLGGLTVIAPLVLGASIQSKKEEDEAGSSGEGDDATITGITIKNVNVEIDDDDE